MGTSEPSPDGVGAGGDRAPLAVLILEDRETDAELMLHDLRRAGFEPSGIRVDTAEAFASELAGGYDVILADFNLPGMDTLAALDLVVARGVEAPTIVVSGSLTDEEALRCTAHGASDYVLKEGLGRLPFAVRRALLDRQAQRRAEEQRALLVREQAARAAIAAERDRLRQVLEVSPEGVAIADGQGRIVLSNEAARAIWGQEAPSVEARGYEAFGARRSDGSDYPSEELPLARSVLRGEVVRGEQLLLRNARIGEWTPVLVNSAPLRDDAGAVTGGVVVFQDISAFKHAERQKNEFLASVSHDLKNPIAGVMAQAQLLRRRISRGDVDPTRLVDIVERIEDTARRATRMIDELLDVTRQHMGLGFDLNLAALDLVSLARHVAEDQQRATEWHEIRFEAAPERIDGKWDGVRLERALTNLVSNAVKYSPDGGVIRVAVGHDGDGATIEVQDRGLGIPEAALPRIFERYFRAENASAFAGSGIGLISALQIVQAHGGQIDVQSREGEGSTFTVRPPIPQPAASA